MSLRHRFWLLTALRWLPTGLIIPVIALLPLHRGMTVAQLGSAMAVQGIVVLCLELPTGGLADTLGRRPLVLLSATVALVSYVLFSLATTPLLLACAAGAAGVFRALDSGPLNAWFVDRVHAATPVAARADTVTSGLGGASAVLGASIATGSMLSAGLVAWAPFGTLSALVVPFIAAAAVAVVQIVAVATLMDEPRRPARPLSPVSDTVRAIADGARLLTRSRVLAALIAVELFWGFGMVTFETLMPVRLSELVSGKDAAAAAMGPIVAAAWACSALGSMAVPALTRRWGLVGVSIALRLLQGATVIAMGLAWGPVALVTAYFATYAVHIAAGVAYESLLHREVDDSHRATVLSLASMVGQPAGSLGLVVLGAIATGASTGTAIIVGGIVLAVAAPLFLVRPRDPDPEGPSGR